LPASEPADAEAIASALIIRLSAQKTIVFDATTPAGFSTFNRTDNIREIVQVISQVRGERFTQNLRNFERNPGSGRLPKHATAQAVRESVHVIFRQ
jgi:hypothetical protein